MIEQMYNIVFNTLNPQQDCPVYAKIKASKVAHEIAAGID